MSEQNEKNIFRFIEIPLDGFEPVHAAHDGNRDLEHLFVGRKVIIDKLVNLLKSKSPRGSYLIAGYRGAGKTSVINKALDKFRDGVGEKRKALVVRINLGDNSELTPLNIYYSIASILRDEIVHESYIDYRKLKEPPKPISEPKRINLIKFLHKRYINYREFRLPLKRINELVERMSFEISISRNVGLNPSLKASIFSVVANLVANLGYSKEQRRLPINAREAEEQLFKILKQIGDTNRKIVIVLDEIDKLSDNEELPEIQYSDRSNAQESGKITRINTLLGSLKNFIATADATFFFISGRETLDRYYSEKGSSNSLYESLFNQVFEVPSFLTDEGMLRPRGTRLSALIEEYVCRRIRKKIDKEEDNSDYYTLKKYRESLHNDPHNKGMEAEIRRSINTLRSFIHYLTFHSWGNPKKLSSIFESFVVVEEDSQGVEKDKSTLFMRGESDTVRHRLRFNINNQRSFSLASELTTLFQHQLSREVSKISDKLTVSTLSSLHFILKLHSYGFTRESLHRMSEAINVYRSPELNTIIDDLLTHVFKSYMRRVRNGIFRYRFNSGFEQELRYISHVSELESATYNFSLDSMRHVKRFFEDIILSHRDGKETGVISRSHITLGDMCAIEQSYTSASLHYSTAGRILAGVLHEPGSRLDQETLMLYIEAMIKHGDLEERRQNYNHAIAIYSEADRAVKRFSLIDEDLRRQLQTGDSKWDLLKQPFWAGHFLSLKRSPSTVELKSPYYLYGPEDRRFYYRAASLYFFLGKTITAFTTYRKALRLGSKDVNLQLPDERSAYSRGKARVGLVESFLTYQAHELFNLDGNEASLATEKEPPSPLGGEREFAEKLLNTRWALPEDPNDIRSQISHMISHKVIHRYINIPLSSAAKSFEQNHLYISAAFTHIKTISYYTAILDVFDGSIFENDPGKRAELEALTDEARTVILTRGKDAIRCIDKARQLETSQSNKNLLLYDEADEISITKLFDMLLQLDTTKKYPVEEPLFWQNSLWAHKLAVTLCWAHYVIRKIKLKAEDYVSDGIIPSNLPGMLGVSGFSVRPAILLRWICARDLNRQYIDKKLMTRKGKKYNANNILTDLSGAELTKPGKAIVGNIFRLTKEGNNVSRKDIEKMTLKKAYFISRYLYFAQESSRIISRKNLDLVFPRLPQLYFAQWKLLLNLISAMLVKYRETTENTGERLNSIRDFSFLLQKAFVAIDKELAPEERIAPSHFDYEFIHLRLSESIESSINLVDRTSRTHTGIFQHKYFCHDDHSDPDFRMDYTLAYMFAPRARYLNQEVEKTHRRLDDLTADRIT